MTSKPPTRRTTRSASRRSAPRTSKPPTRRTTRAIRDNIFIFQRITSWHPPIASSASLLFNYFIPKGFSEQLFYEAKRKLQKKGSYKKDEMLFPVSYCSHLYKPIPFLLCTSSSFPLVRNGPSAAAAPYWTATPCAQGNVADIAHDDRRVAGSARRFGPKRYTADFRGLLPERWSPPYEVTLDSGCTGAFRA